MLHPPGVGRPEIPIVFPTIELLLPGELATSVLEEPERLGPSFVCAKSKGVEGPGERVE